MQNTSVGSELPTELAARFGSLGGCPGLWGALEEALRGRPPCVGASRCPPRPEGFRPFTLAAQKRAVTEAWPWLQGTPTSKLDALGPAARADFNFLLKLLKIESWGGGGGEKQNLGFGKNTLWPRFLRI